MPLIRGEYVQKWASADNLGLVRIGDMREVQDYSGNKFSGSILETKQTAILLVLSVSSIGKDGITGHG